MEFRETALPGVLLVIPRRLGDSRGYFCETYHRDRFAEAGIDAVFVQDNQSRSGRNVLRGLHHQWPRPQGKLVRVVSGAAYDVAVDIRKSSPSFGRWVGMELSADNGHMLWLPPGFAHGFCSLTDSIDLVYKCTDVYVADAQQAIAWNDPDIGIHWPIGDVILSETDRRAERLRDQPALPP